MTGLLLDTELSPEQRTYARAISTSATTLLSLIDECSTSPDRGWQDRAALGAVRHRRRGARRGRALGATRPGQGSGDRLVRRARPAEDGDRR
ncbi:hypothetical protein [Methyloceanibacter superfactus]|uniref:hypothetical protein n=1 Tax=Methyloceanibacter superfactus TaxID=1774969 RepID=UPI003CC79E42